MITTEQTSGKSSHPRLYLTIFVIIGVAIQIMASHVLFSVSPYDNKTLDLSTYFSYVGSLVSTIGFFIFFFLSLRPSLRERSMLKKFITIILMIIGSISLGFVITNFFVFIFSILFFGLPKLGM